MVAPAAATTLSQVDVGEQMEKSGGALEMLSPIRNTVKGTLTEAVTVQESLDHPSSHSAPTAHLVSRSQGFQQLSLKPKDAPFPVQKQPHATYEESSNSDFGIVPSDSLVNPSSSGRISYMNSNNSDSFLQFDVKEANNQQYLVHHFIDDWSPKDQSGRTTSGPWLEESKSDWTQLSMSIHVASNFS
ncbi:hypothetical protein OROGR_028575 [Orobanche gracilis]